MCNSLHEKGWRYLLCKFDQEVRPQPLSTITSAFDSFLLDIVGKHDNAEQQQITTRLVSVFDNGDIKTLCQLIPTLNNLVPMNEAHSKPSKISFTSGDAAAAKCRLHRLFGLLVKTLSCQEHPLLLVLDDLQWADAASIDLINSLAEGVVCEELNEETTNKREGPYNLFVGCYRKDEAAESSSLATCIRHLKGISTVALKEVKLEGISCEDVNAIVSASLCSPRRLTRSLSNLIHQKTAGSPLFVKEFLNNLSTENLLTYSLSKHKWQFDEDLIQLKTVSDGVADLLARRLERLPDDALKALQIMACLGSEVSFDILLQLESLCGSSINAGLDLASKDLLIKKKPNGSYSFVHDMIQQAVYHSQNKKERLQMMKEIADTLIARTASVERKGAVLFIIVDLINRVGPDNTSSKDDRALYAQLNLSAGDEAMKTPDYSSACLYIEHGISFLDDAHWTHQYNLSLALFEKAALVHWAVGKMNLMTKRINEVSISIVFYSSLLRI